MNEIIKEALKYNDIGNLAIAVLFISAIIYILKQLIQLLISRELKSIDNEHTKKLKELESKIEKQKQQLEHRHQVSKETYQKLFQEKINIYQRLTVITSQYPKILNKNSSKLSDDEFEYYLKLYIEQLKKISDIIESNKLFISNELLKSYEKLISESEKFDSKLQNLEKESIMITENEAHQSYYQEEETNKIFEKISQGTKIHFLEFYKILNHDILKIKKKINLD